MSPSTLLLCYNLSNHKPIDINIYLSLLYFVPLLSEVALKMKKMNFIFDICIANAMDIVPKKGDLCSKLI